MPSTPLKDIAHETVVWNQSKIGDENWTEIARVLGIGTYHVLYADEMFHHVVYVQIPESGSMDGLRRWREADRNVMQFDVTSPLPTPGLKDHDYEKMHRMTLWVCERAAEQVRWENLSDTERKALAGGTS